MSRRQNVSTSKIPAPKRRRQTVLTSKTSCHQNFSAPKHLHVKSRTARSPYGECAHGKMYQRLSVLTEKCLTEKSPMETYQASKKYHSKNSLRKTVFTVKCTYGSVSKRQKFYTGNMSHGEFFFTAKHPTAKIPTAKGPTAKSPYSGVIKAKFTYG